jgi:hypothetical protein
MLKMLAKKRMSLVEVAREINAMSNATTKPAYVWEAYEAYLAPLADKQITLIEVGVDRGFSLMTLSRYFREARILGVDAIIRDMPLGAMPNVKLFEADQRDRKKLDAICDKAAPSGLDVVIDDASHIGAYSLETYRALFPRVKPGGLYVIEAWQTGYMPSWPDGEPMREAQLLDPKGDLPRRIASHDFGMVGFVKSLIEKLAQDDTTYQWIHFHRSMVVLKKT